MNVDPADTHVLLFALIGVDVVVSQNDAPSPGAVGGQSAETLYFFTHAFALGAQSPAASVENAAGIRDKQSINRTYYSSPHAVCVDGASSTCPHSERRSSPILS